MPHFIAITGKKGGLETEKSPKPEEVGAENIMSLGITIICWELVMKADTFDGKFIHP